MIHDYSMLADRFVEVCAKEVPTGVYVSVTRSYVM